MWETSLLQVSEQWVWSHDLETSVLCVTPALQSGLSYVPLSWLMAEGDKDWVWVPVYYGPFPS